MSETIIASPWKDRFKEPAAFHFLLLLLSADFVFICLHVLTKTRFGSPLLSLEVDGSYSEFFNYTKEFWIVILFISIAVKTGVKGFYNWALLFIYFLAFFGIAVDMLHMIIKVGNIATFILGMIEDGGELVVMSFILWYVFLVQLKALKFSNSM